ANWRSSCHGAAGGEREAEGPQHQAASHRGRVYAQRGASGKGGQRREACGTLRGMGHTRATGGTLPELLETLVADHGSREALVSSRGRLRFDEVAALADRVAGALAARGVVRGTHVGLLLPNWPEWVAIAFGVWRCGGVLVPLNTLYRPRELA